MRRDDIKFILAALAAVLLAATLVYRSYLREVNAALGPVVDLEKIEALQQKGIVSLHPAAHWEIPREQEK